MKNNNKKSKLKIQTSGKKLAYFLLTLTVFSQAYAQLEMKKHTINSGGATMSGGGFELKASIGQVDSDDPSSGGNYSLSSGFWQQNTDLIFKDNLE